MKCMSSRVTREIPPPSKKGSAGRRNRLKGARGRGTLKKEKPPILGIIQRGGEVAVKMLANVKQATIKPIIMARVAAGALIHTDEYTWLRPHRGISQKKLPLYLSFFQLTHNAPKLGKAWLYALVEVILAP
jgi:transposase